MPATTRLRAACHPSDPDVQSGQSRHAHLGRRAVRFFRLPHRHGIRQSSITRASCICRSARLMTGRTKESTNNISEPRSASIGLSRSCGDPSNPCQSIPREDHADFLSRSWPRRAPAEWKSHGEKIPDSKYIWMAFIGPDTPALGERSNIGASDTGADCCDAGWVAWGRLRGSGSEGGWGDSRRVASLGHLRSHECERGTHECVRHAATSRRSSGALGVSLTTP